MTTPKQRESTREQKKTQKTKTENCIESCVTNRQRNFSETVKRISHKVYEVNYEKKECLH